MHPAGRRVRRPGRPGRCWCPAAGRPGSWLARRRSTAPAGWCEVYVDMTTPPDVGRRGAARGRPRPRRRPGPDRARCSSTTRTSSPSTRSLYGYPDEVVVAATRQLRRGSRPGRARRPAAVRRHAPALARPSSAPPDRPPEGVPLGAGHPRGPQRADQAGPGQPALEPARLALERLGDVLARGSRRTASAMATETAVISARRPWET